jgi:hypothetical protein
MDFFYFLLPPYLGAGSHIEAQGWLLSFLDLFTGSRDSLDGWSARHKAST